MPMASLATIKTSCGVGQSIDEQRPTPILALSTFLALYVTRPAYAPKDAFNHAKYGRQTAATHNTMNGGWQKAVYGLARTEDQAPPFLRLHSQLNFHGREIKDSAPCLARFDRRRIGPSARCDDIARNQSRRTRCIGQDATDMKQGM